jgi:hypothetical protein
MKKQSIGRRDFGRRDFRITTSAVTAAAAIGSNVSLTAAGLPTVAKHEPLTKVNCLAKTAT